MKITPQLFEAHLKCPTKCWLRSTGEQTAGNAYAEWVQTENESYRATAARQLMADVPADECAPSPGSSRREEAHYSAENLKTAKWRLAPDVLVRTPESEPRSSRGNEAQTAAAEPSPLNSQPVSQSLLTSAATTVECRLHAVERVPSEGRGKPAQFIPIRFIFTNKLTKDDRLLLAFDALVLSQALGREVRLGKIIHGDDHACLGAARKQATLKVKTSALAGEVRKRLENIAALLSSPAPPDLVLNRHCAECEFQARCRKIAVEKDDLSLLSSMSAKERQKLRSKGIFTVTQLSYTFRPRRRPKRLRDKREKYHHSLKALAIREKKIHIVGSPELTIEGTPVYLDVEGLPDRDFYYLIGVRIGNGESAVQHSLWADIVEDEGKIWREFLAILETVERPVLVHYGSFEGTFLNRMRERYVDLAENVPLLDGLTKGAVNLLAVIYGQVYFPTRSNGLKDVAGFVGFRWPDPEGTGPISIMWRRRWEESQALALQQNLFAYNSADCEACESLSKTLSQLPSPERSENRSRDGRFAFVADNLPNAFSHPDWQKFESTVPELEQINHAAQWDYQRDRIHVRDPKPLRRKTEITPRARKQISHAERVVSFPQCPVCPKCLRRSNDETGQESRFFHDLLFRRSLVKRRIVRHDFHKFWCEACRLTFGVPERFHSCQGLGWNLVALYFYSAIELAFPQRPVAKLLERLFDISISGGVGSRLKTRVGKYYEITRQKLIEKLASGHLVHVDETRARIRGNAGYVWVFATVEEVVYLYSESREAEVMLNLFRGFKGVLVSDFYAAYDSPDCPQQKCLIHLIRDLNNEVLAQPYNEELKEIVRDFGMLLKPIIDTIDRYGLKRHFLKKHLTSVRRFFERLSLSEYRSEAALKLKLRFEKNHDTLFTFLRYDGVPWNNNNAEHAVKAYARLRKICLGVPTPKAISEYLILLSICQTCKYMGVDFLDFLRSGERDIHAFAESRRGRRRRKQTSPPTNLQTDAIMDGAVSRDTRTGE